MEIDIKAKYSKLVSKKECLEVVSKALGDVHLLSYEVVPASSDIVGYLGDYYKLNVIYSDKNKERHKSGFFIKSLPQNNELHKHEIVSKGFMEKERLAYSTLFKDMEAYSPYKWHADVYLVRNDLIVFEDLVQSGYKVENLSFNFLSTHVLAVLECAAAMHANSIIFEEKTGKNIGIEYKQVAKVYNMLDNTWISTGLKAVCKVASVHPKLQSSEYQNFIRTELRDRLNAIYELAEPFKNYKNTISHRDLWEKNIMFKFSEDNLQSIFVDFQIACYIPPAFDLVFFLFLNTTKSNRDENMKAYIDHYFDCLQKFTAQQDVNLNGILSRTDFDNSCNKFEEIALILTGVYSPISYLPDGYLGAINQKDPQEFIEIMNIDRDQFVVECIKKFPDYAKRVLDVVEEIINRLYNPENK